MIESDLAGRTPFYFTGTYVTYETKQCNSNNITLRFITYAVAVIVWWYDIFMVLNPLETVSDVVQRQFTTLHTNDFSLGVHWFSDFLYYWSYDLCWKISENKP